MELEDFVFDPGPGFNLGTGQAFTMADYAFLYNQVVQENTLLKKGIAEIFDHLVKIFGSKKCACFDLLAYEPCESHVFLTSYAAKFEEAKKLRDVQLSKKDLPA